MSDKKQHPDEPSGRQPRPEGDAGGGERQAELEALFQRWDERREAEADPTAGAAADEAVGEAPVQRSGLLGGGMRGVLTAVVVALTAFLMWQTRHEFAYWLERGKPPTELGDLSERYKAGERTLVVPSNTYVHAEGLFATYEAETATDGDARVGYFLCPLFDIVVRTVQPFPDDDMRHWAHVEVPAEFAELLERRRAFPSDFLTSFEITGRLVRASDAPSRLERPIRIFANNASLEPSAMWVLLEGETPDDYTRYALIWLLAPLLALASIALFATSALRRRRARPA